MLLFLTLSFLTE